MRHISNAMIADDGWVCDDIYASNIVGHVLGGDIESDLESTGR